MPRVPRDYLTHATNRRSGLYDRQDPGLQEVPGQSQAGRLIAVEVRIAPEKQQALQSLGFEQDLVRHPLAFASQILDQPVHSPDDASVNDLVLASGVHVVSHHHSEGFELTCRIPLPAC